MVILYVKALHIIFVVSWFAGLLYISRLFIYHTEAEEKPQEVRKALQAQFKVMEKRLWYGITWPAMVLTLVFGIWLLEGMDYWRMPWMHVKLCMVGLLLVYHFISHRVFLKLQRDHIDWTSNQLRMWNEVATLFLVAIVFVIVLKDAMNWIYGVIGLVLFAAIIMLAIRIYKRIRTGK